MSEPEIERLLIWAIVAGVAIMAAGFLAMGLRRKKDRHKDEAEK